MTVLVSNNVANIAAASVATAVLVEFLPAGQAATGSTVVTSFFVIAFGEIAPKSYAVAHAERHALRVRAEGGSLADAATDPVFVPAVKPVDELLAEMQFDGYRMAMVVDEFGTVVGLATFEDVIEELVGELFDSAEADPVRVVDEDTAIVNGWATVDYVNERLGLALQTDGPFETTAGLVNHHAGRLAEEGDRVELDGVVITVLDATQRRVRRVRVDWSPASTGEYGLETPGE